MREGEAPEAVVGRDKFVVATGLAVIAGISWLYLLYLADGMSGSTMAAMTDAALKPWSLADAVLMFVMWAVMMVAMMTPSAAPMIVLYATLARKGRAQDRPFAPTAVFVAGYLAVWTGFSTLATALQWSLEQAALLSPMMAASSPYFGGALLVAAGLYQLTPLKDVCLKHCRAPLIFLTTHWRGGTAGAFRMGLVHGLYCLGCCWALMAILFAVGIMNLLWVAAITALVLLEKVVPAGTLLVRGAGIALAVAGVWRMAAA